MGNIDSYSMLIVGKYFQSKNDYFNIIQVSHKFHDLIEKYRFNPISDANIFPRIETQHLYTSSDVKLPNIHQYIYWKSLNYIEYLQRNTQNERYPNVCLSYKDYSVDPIKMNAIHPCELFKTQFPLTAQTINFPTSIHHLSTRALTALQNLTSLTIPTSIVSLGESCCGSLTSLQNVVMSSSVTTIKQSCFNGCVSLTSLQLSENLTSIPDYTFRQCSSLKTITFPPYIDIIGTGAFYLRQV
ncbi:Leucine rich repeat protein [Entamoeba marina]